jgi:mannose-6-phosphate isomerase-like protein (cupin superfamily)
VDDPTMMDMKQHVIHRSSGSPTNVQQFGPYQIEPLLTEQEEAAATVYRVRVEANQHTSTSYHNIAEEFYFVLSGTATAILDGSPRSLAPGDFLRLPPGTRHAFVTQDTPLEMLDMHVPGCRPGRDTYFTDETSTEER